MGYTAHTAIDRETEEFYQHAVLLVEDDRALRMVLCEQLTQLGCHVLEAENGQQAHDILKLNSTEIDLIILDRSMPVMGGMELIELIKRDEALKDKVVVMSTGHGQPDQVRQGINAGVFYYLVKPVNDTVLAAVVKAGLQENRQRQQRRALTHKQHNGFGLMAKGNFEIRTIDEARVVAQLLSQSYADPFCVAPGIEALLINAIEQSDRAVTSGKAMGPVTVQADYYRHTTRHVLVVKDRGCDFDWKNHLKDPHHRIARACECFDELVYNEEGNQAIAVLYFPDGAGAVE